MLVGEELGEGLGDGVRLGEGEGIGVAAEAVKLIASRDIVPFFAPDAKSSPALLSLHAGSE